MKNPPPISIGFCLSFLFLILQGVGGAEDGIGQPTASNSADRTIYDLGDRMVVLEEVGMDVLPKIEPIDDRDPEVRKEQSDELGSVGVIFPEVTYLLMAGTVYRFSDGSTSSRIQCFGPGDSGLLVLWSSIDWNVLRGGRFELANGRQIALTTMLSTWDEASAKAAARALGMSWQPPETPEFSSEKATFRFLSGKPSQQLLDDLTALHEIYDRDRDELHAVALVRAGKEAEAARLRELEAANPPPPEDIHIQYRVMTPEELAGN